jgi:hypothetical protein
MKKNTEIGKRVDRLRWWNIGVGSILGIQAIAIAVLANGFSLDVTSTYMSGPPGSQANLTRLFSLPVGLGVFAFLFISSAALLVIASPAIFPWYKRNLIKNRNYGRWIEYFLSSSIMIVLISMLCGISDIAALIAIFGVNASMILFGLLMEKYESPGSPDWLAFGFGSFAGAVPWLGIIFYFFSIGVKGPSPPGFVYGIVITLFLLFNCFAVNMILQYKKVGPWRDYLFGEKMYILLSLTAKALLAWQVFFPTLL